MHNRFTWTAVYTDGTRLNQVEPDGSKHAYGDIDRSRLASFELWDGQTRVLHIPFTPNQQLIWRRRVEMSPGGQMQVCHVIGKKETVNGKRYQGVIGVFESDGHTEVLGQFEEGHPWLYPPMLSKEESGR